MKYLKKYLSKAEYEKDYYDGKLAFPHVVLVDGEVVYADEFKQESDDRVPLYIEAIEDLTVSFSINAIQYSLDNLSWVDLPADTATPTITPGNKVYFRASGITPSTSNGIGKFTINGYCNIGGNIMSMLYGADYIGKRNMVYSYAFYRLFSATKIIDASKLALPPGTIMDYGCYEMFRDCSNLTLPPMLPSTQLNQYCYFGMFRGCVSLQLAPKEILAPFIPRESCAYMFYGCSKITRTPRMNITSINEYGCEYMFCACTNLIDASRIALYATNNYSYSHMFDECASLISIPKFLAEKANSYCYQYMFSKCISLERAPIVIQTPSFGNFACTYMFYKCEKLVEAPLLPSTGIYNGCYNSMFRDCTSLVEAPELPATSGHADSYNYMFYGCINLSRIKMMHLSAISFTSWVYNVQPKGTFVKNSAATWADTFGVNAIPEGWTVETADA